MIVNTRYFAYAFGFLVFASFANRSSSQILEPSLMIKCEYTECSDLTKGSDCFPRKKPVQTFNFHFNKKQVIEDGNGTNAIIKNSYPNVLFGRIYDTNPTGMLGMFERITERYLFNRKTYNIKKEVEKRLIYRIGDLDEENPDLDRKVSYKGKCSSFTTKNHLQQNESTQNQTHSLQKEF